ncbi:hypothetical protein HAZT_HAZT004229 [Hyalella azteca]|uniref:Peptidase S1 domain-containing protein n=1 Tax=Hyalella azteca TaxID=294128 RepID=A0A6A0GZM5_HYAAZ|nr:hypothetical protein HAZT_HAZT004229 [Hyalella azteca]
MFYCTHASSEDEFHEVNATGDSGGPLVACNFNSCTQVGVVSFGFPLCTNVGLPAVFTRLTYYRPWLDSNMASLSAIPV